MTSTQTCWDAKIEIIHARAEAAESTGDLAKMSKAYEELEAEAVARSEEIWKLKLEIAKLRIQH